MNVKGSKHLNLSERIKIQELLGKGLKLKEITSEINKDERTISKEIKSHRIVNDNKRFYFGRGSKIVPIECSKLNRFPFVCNGCKDKRGCRYYHNASYDAKTAQDEYETLLKESRSGLDMSLEDKIKLDVKLKEGSDKGQSLYHIFNSSEEPLPCSLRTAYRLVDESKTLIQNIDLVRKVKLKPRKHYLPKDNKNNKYLEGRRYEDFIRFISLNGYPSVVEIDTVEGPKGKNEKCLLTIHINAAHFTLAFLLNSKSQEEVSKVFVYLQKLLGIETYKRIFQVILTDRGVEFIDYKAIEFSYLSGEALTHVFYTNAYASYQKGSIEEDHELIRRIIPKGTSMNDLSQNNINTIMSHILSYHRQSIESTPYTIFKIMYGKDILDKLKIREIAPDQVTLKPTILK